MATKPHITGPDSIQLKPNETFPLESYQAKSSSGLSLALELPHYLDTKKSGDSLIYLKANDPQQHVLSFYPVHLHITDPHPPEIIGAKNLIFTLGETPNLLQNVTAQDVEDGDISANLHVKGKINLTSTTPQTVTYTVQDKSGNETEKNVTLQFTKPVEKIISPIIPPVEKTNETSLSPNSIYILNTRISYVSAGQSGGKQLIDGNPQLASTFYGASFSGTDGDFTHFIGHTPGGFSLVPNLEQGDVITVTDSHNQAFSYEVYQVATISMENGGDGYVYPTNHEAEVLTDELYYHQLTGEKIVLQTCLTDGGTLIRLVYGRIK